MCCYSSLQTCSSLWSPCVWLVHIIQISVQMSACREALPHHLPEKPVHHTLHSSSSEPLSQFQAFYNCFGYVTTHTTYREEGDGHFTTTYLPSAGNSSRHSQGTRSSTVMSLRPAVPNLHSLCLGQQTPKTAAWRWGHCVTSLSSLNTC